MLTIWFIGLYIMFIIQQLTIIWLFKKLEKKPPSYDIGYWLKKGLESSNKVNKK